MEFNELVEDMKKFFGVTSLEKVAEKLGYKQSVATTWRGRKSFSKNAILEYNLIKSQSGKNPSFLTKNPPITYYPNVTASAGYGIGNFSSEAYPIYNTSEFLDAFKIFGKKLDVIRVDGVSMEPYIENGDFAFIDREANPKNGDIVLAVFDDNLYIKQYESNPSDNSIRLISKNDKYASFSIDSHRLEMLQIIGVLKATIKINRF
ncbi:hypothetical protein BKH46_08860 [Helicobacter sp. 12S02634-8]|uniref:S24 family peptidase n=1 Tax=Helicobacter sp. 12S02634-8 TaxID=1476199 RepID=UPI000BA63D70|nr:S24 family peptidase [Helicobacter sp. 12S02634-8]PAF46146.1 hypothetical protein BKH46_08860 [Helicobacter sp. 12S02634-8]